MILQMASLLELKGDTRDLMTLIRTIILLEKEMPMLMVVLDLDPDLDLGPGPVLHLLMVHLLLHRPLPPHQTLALMFNNRLLMPPPISPPRASTLPNQILHQNFNRNHPHLLLRLTQHLPLLCQQIQIQTLPHTLL